MNMKKLKTSAWFSSDTLAALALAFFMVLTHWGFWDKGVMALGWNASVFWIGLLGYLFHKSPSPKLKKRSAIWIPLLLMALSFGLYENPWLKFISLAVLPLSTGVFYLYGQMESGKKRWWGLDFLSQLGHHLLKPTMKVEKSVTQLTQEIFRFKSNKRAKSILIGLGILLILLLVVVLPLLGSADAVFNSYLNTINKKIADLLNGSLIWRSISFITLSVAFLAFFKGWIGKIQLKDEPELKAHDDWISGIVLGGLLGTYLLFLSIQVSYLFVGSLPINFNSTVQFVKSGFWQLFFLSILNGVLFFNFYRRTQKPAQIILKVFIMTSGLLLVSAAWRMALYVTNHGLSYEKFFAAYTTLFGLIVFIILAWASFSKKKLNLFKAFSFMALWFYAIATVLPVEQIILRSNVALSQSEDSKIELVELIMLSADVYGVTKTEYVLWGEDGFLFWEAWLTETEKDINNREWYEYNFSLIMNK
ncbi:MAG: hypothetical protein ACI9QC_000914 [Oceanicoccus sp.]|jgi:hypothetical protein